MLRFRKTIVAKQEFNDAKKPIKIWDVHVNNIVERVFNFNIVEYSFQD